MFCQPPRNVSIPWKHLPSLEGAGMLQGMYTTNPFLPRVRRDTVNLVRLKGWGVREAARRMGVAPGTVSKWLRRASASTREYIPTISSAPHTSPRRIAQDIEAMIVAERKRTHRCGAVIFATLARRGVRVSLSTVNRVLGRHSLTAAWSPWKKRHEYPPRPIPEKPGILVEIDTIHDGAHDDRLYVYTLLDVSSRWAYAIPTLAINTHHSLRFVDAARQISPFSFATIQSDHGQEFSKWFTKQIVARGMAHRHSRVRTPNDNAHLERFNRTIQDECMRRIPRSLAAWRKEIPEYLQYYNTERLHMGIDYKTPVEKIAELFPRS